jgi:hypothetical protein
MTTPSNRPLPPIDTQELARRNNESVAAQRPRKAWRRQRRKKTVFNAPAEDGLLSKISTEIELLEAQPPRAIRAVGFFLPGKP